MAAYKPNAIIVDATSVETVFDEEFGYIYINIVIQMHEQPDDNPLGLHFPIQEIGDVAANDDDLVGDAAILQDTDDAEDYAAANSDVY